MKIVIINTLDNVGGAAVAAYRLHRSLLSTGVDSRVLVQRKNGDDSTVIGLQNLRGIVLGKIRYHIDSIHLRLYPDRTGVIFSPAFVPDQLHKKIETLCPDLIHLHWIAEGFLRIESLKKFNRPIIWTLHDSWAFTGGCHIPFDCTRYTENCGKCPTLGSNDEHDLSRWIWQRKKKSWEGLNLTVVCPSRWLADCARASALFHDVPVKVIPNGLNLTRFRPFDKQLARAILGLSKSKKLILFGAMDSTRDRNKGFHLLLPALRYLAQSHLDKYELIVFGASEPSEESDLGLRSHYLGRLHDEVALSLTYAAADVFVAPSLQENLSYTIMESLACGTPCVAFNIGGMPDMIEHEQTGYLAHPYDPEDLARGISWILDDEARWYKLARQARAKVERNFSIENVTEQYVNLYKEIAGDPATTGKQNSRDTVSVRERDLGGTLFNPVVSIITVVYNDKDNLEQTILSVLRQTYRNIEFIIVDGNSSDGTVDIIRRYESHIAQWVTEPDSGIYDAMNKGLRMATGDYVWFVNAGDQINDQNTIEEALKTQSFADVYFGKTQLIRSDVFPVHVERAPDNLTKDSMARGMVVSHQSIIVKRSIAPFYDLRYKYGSDHDWIIRVLKQSTRIVNTSIILSKYLLGGFSQKNFLGCWKERIFIINRHYTKRELLMNILLFAREAVRVLLPRTAQKVCRLYWRCFSSAKTDRSERCL